MSAMYVVRHSVRLVLHPATIITNVLEPHPDTVIAINDKSQRRECEINKRTRITPAPTRIPLKRHLHPQPPTAYGLC